MYMLYMNFSCFCHLVLNLSLSLSRSTLYILNFFVHPCMHKNLQALTGKEHLARVRWWVVEWSFLHFPCLLSRREGVVFRSCLFTFFRFRSPMVVVVVVGGGSWLFSAFKCSIRRTNQISQDTLNHNHARRQTTKAWELVRLLPVSLCKSLFIMLTIHIQKRFVSKLCWK